MKRWIINILCGLSLLACFAAAGMWVRSQLWVDHARYVWVRGELARLAGESDLFAPGRARGFNPLCRYTAGPAGCTNWEQQLESNQGAVGIRLRRAEFAAKEERLGYFPGWQFWPATRAGVDPLYDFSLTSHARSSPWWQLGFHYLAGTGRSAASRETIWIVNVPYWAITLAAALLPAWLALQQRRRIWRIKAGLCATCGYDLRASKDRCPECGTEFRSLAVHANTEQ